jgi:hypothetical protein
MKHIIDIENRAHVTPVVDTDDAASIESTDDDAGSDTTYLTALSALDEYLDAMPPLDSSGSSPADSMVVTPEEREGDFFALALNPVNSMAEAEGDALKTTGYGESKE